MFTHIIGIDISKLKIDACLLKSGQQHKHTVFSNDKEGFKQMSKWLTGHGVTLIRSLFCMEHTGCYGDLLRSWVNAKGYPLALESGLQISLASLGTRGKTDQIDAYKIARYFHFRQEELTLDKPRQYRIKQLKALFGQRRRLVKVRQMLKAADEELGRFTPEGHTEALKQSSARVIDCTSKEISYLEDCISALIEQEEKLKHNYNMITSVVGVGMQTAVSVLLITENFTRVDSPRKFACYVGIAPFPRQSGSSMKDRPRVSHLGDKETKSVLSMAAGSAINHDPQLRQFHQRKIEQGKPEQSVRNAVMNKLVHRIYAAVNRGTPYVPLGKHAA